MTFKREKLNSPYCQPLLVWVFRKLSKQTRRQFVFPPFDAEKHGVRSAKETKHSLKANRASDQDSAGSASKGGRPEICNSITLLLCPLKKQTRSAFDSCDNTVIAWPTTWGCPPVAGQWPHQRMDLIVSADALTIRTFKTGEIGVSSLIKK